jgi:hypothetical protein
MMGDGDVNGEMMGDGDGHGMGELGGGGGWDEIMDNKAVQTCPNT